MLFTCLIKNMTNTYWQVWTIFTCEVRKTKKRMTKERLYILSNFWNVFKVWKMYHNSYHSQNAAIVYSVLRQFSILSLLSLFRFKMIFLSIRIHLLLIVSMIHIPIYICYIKGKTLQQNQIIEVCHAVWFLHDVNVRICKYEHVCFKR